MMMPNQRMATDEMAKPDQTHDAAPTYSAHEMTTLPQIVLRDHRAAPDQPLPLAQT